MPIVKANAYGHGLSEIAEVLAKHHPAALGVAYGEEALELRAMKYRGRIVVLSYWQTHELADLIDQNIELVVWDSASLAAVVDAAKRLKKKPKIHIKLDTGTSRIGWLQSDIAKLQPTLHRLKGINIVGVFSHLANAEEGSTTRTKKQIKYLTTLKSRLHLNDRVEQHLACTAAILRYPEARFGLVRPGIGLYGLWPSGQIEAWSKANLPKFKLKPVLEWKSSIAQIKRLSAGQAVGYGATWKAKRTSLIAAIPVGYSDGYYRSFSNRSWVMIRGHKAPVVGRISMNLFMIDVTNVPNVQRDETVTLLGPGISADTLNHLGYETLNYEITTTIHPGISRILI